MLSSYKTDINEIVYNEKVKTWNLYFNYYKFVIKYDLNMEIRVGIEAEEITTKSGSN